MNKKADLSINIIVVAVLALLVLVVLMYIFSSKINIFGKGASNCGGVCQDFNGKTGNQVCEDYSNGIQGAITGKKTYSYNPGATCKSSTGQEQACCIGIET